MGERVIVWADEPVPYGADVLVRGVRAMLAPPALVNARVVSRPHWMDEDGVIPAGRSFAVEMLSVSRDLQALADGPIMDPNALFLPEGRISLAEARARERASILEARL